MDPKISGSVNPVFLTVPYNGFNHPASPGHYGKDSAQFPGIPLGAQFTALY